MMMQVGAEDDGDSPCGAVEDDEDDDDDDDEEEEEEEEEEDTVAEEGEQEEELQPSPSLFCTTEVAEEAALLLLLPRATHFWERILLPLYARAAVSKPYPYPALAGRCTFMSGAWAVGFVCRASTSVRAQASLERVPPHTHPSTCCSVEEEEPGPADPPDFPLPASNCV